jgi:hypothetical protein
MIKYLVIISFSIGLLGCKSVGIEYCDKKSLHYSGLPKEVKSVIFEGYFKDPHSSNIYSSFKDLNEPYRYFETSEQTFFLPWVYKQYLHRIEDDKIFKIDISSEHGSTKIVLNDYLYVAQHYNIYKKDSSNYSFTRYTLE